MTRDAKTYNNPWVKADISKLYITQQDRCDELNDVGGCMIRGDCSRRTKEGRAEVLCKCEEGLSKQKRKKAGAPWPRTLSTKGHIHARE